MSTSGYTPKRPFIFRAYFDWLVHNDLTPYVVVNANSSKVSVPSHVIGETGEVVLNLSPSAIRDYLIDTEGVSFSARFNGQAQSIFFPFEAVACIYCLENPNEIMFLWTMNTILKWLSLDLCRQM